jgi:hypothetical protein
MKIKGVIHVHSTYSYDGKESLQSLRDFLTKKDIAFCCLTEHTDQMTLEQAQLFVQECKMLSTSQFVFIPGFEVPYGKAHMLLLGTEVFLGQNADAQMLKTWSNASALTILAHPVRNAFIVDEIMEQILDGIEIWNQQYEGKLVPRFRSKKLLRKLQEKSPTLLAMGGLDFHRVEHFGSPLYTLELDHLTQDTVLRALKEGRYSFGTNGLDVSATGLWKGDSSFTHKTLSIFSISVIVLGKKMNAFLALLGIKPPKGLKRFIRSRV